MVLDAGTMGDLGVCVTGEEHEITALFLQIKHATCSPEVSQQRTMEEMLYIGKCASLKKRLKKGFIGM